MTVADIQKILDAEVLTGEEHLQRETGGVYCSDMMSDVLAYADDHSVLVTGLCNAQVIRTAEMLDMACIVFVRGKRPDENMCRLADECQMTILMTPQSMFSASGKLYQAGLR